MRLTPVNCVPLLDYSVWISTWTVFWTFFGFFEHGFQPLLLLFPQPARFVAAPVAGGSVALNMTFILFVYLVAGLRSCRELEVLDGIGVGVGLLRILGVRVGIFDPTPTPKVQFNYFSTCFACLILPAAQVSSSWALL